MTKKNVKSTLVIIVEGVEEGAVVNENNDIQNNE